VNVHRPSERKADDTHHTATTTIPLTEQDEREHNVVNISWRYCYSPCQDLVTVILVKTDLDLTPTHCYLMYAVAAWMMQIKKKGPKQEQRIVRKLNLNPMAYERNMIRLNTNKRARRDTT
jgi:hypothetical protein